MTPDANIEGLRILLFVPSFQMGGAQRQAVILARGLRKEHGADAMVCGFSAPALASDMCDRFGVPWRRVPFEVKGSFGAPTKAARLLRLASWIRRMRPGVLLTYCHNPNVDAGLVWRLTGARTCIWGQRDAGAFRRGPLAMRIAARGVPRFISNSAGGADFLARELRVPRGRIAVIPNAVEAAPPAEPRDAWRQRYGIPGGAFCAVMLSNKQRVGKDHETLLRAWAIAAPRMSEDGPDARLVLIGDDFDGAEAALKALAFDLRLSGVHFLPAIGDTNSALHAMDLCVHISRSEGMPNSVTEAMAAGLAVVASDITPIRSIFGDIDYPHLVPPGDPGRLAGELVSMQRGADERARWGARLQQHVTAEYPVPKMVEATCNVIRAALGRSGQ